MSKPADHVSPNPSDHTTDQFMLDEHEAPIPQSDDPDLDGPSETPVNQPGNNDPEAGVKEPPIPLVMSIIPRGRWPIVHALIPAQAVSNSPTASTVTVRSTNLTTSLVAGMLLKRDR